MAKQDKKTFLFHFIAGIASINPFPPSRVGRDFLSKSDKEALYSDWKAIGFDMKNAIEQVKNEQQKPQQARKA